MELTEAQLNEIKRIELEIFAEFIKVCKKLNLKYYLLGGTLLGAVRHKGFIPWDDDIDVGMLREDYEIFISKADKLLPNNLFLQTSKSDPNVPFNFCKIRNNNTTFVEKSVKSFKINHGVYIDIFPLDFYPNGIVPRSRFKLKKKLLDVKIRKSFDLPFPKGIIARAALILSSFIVRDYREAVRKKDFLFKLTKKSNLIANHCGAWGDKEIVPAEWYGEGDVLEFEGISVIVPKEYDKWLSRVYGNYMELPPMEKRIPHHYVEICDLSKSYKEYTDR